MPCSSCSFLVYARKGVWAGMEKGGGEDWRVMVITMFIDTTTIYSIVGRESVVRILPHLSIIHVAYLVHYAVPCTLSVIAQGSVLCSLVPRLSLCMMTMNSKEGESLVPFFT